MKKLLAFLFTGLSIALSAQSIRIYNLPTVLAANSHDSLIIEKGDSSFLPNATNKIGLNDVKTYINTPQLQDTTLGNNVRYTIPIGTKVLVNLAASNTSDTLYFNIMAPIAGQTFNYASKGAETVLLKGATIYPGNNSTPVTTLTQPFKLMYDARLIGWIRIH